MRLQLRLTLFSMLVMTLVVCIVSAIDLISEINRQFDIAFKRSAPIKSFVIDAVKSSVAHTRRPTLAASVHDDAQLGDQLLDSLTKGPGVVEIAVTDLQDKILNDSDPDRVDTTLPHSDDFAKFVARAPWWDKLRLLIRGQRTYEIYEDMLNADSKPELRIHIVYDPGLLRFGDESPIPVLQTHLWEAGATIFGALLVVLVFSSMAFRPLGKLGEMLDLVARGEYEIQQVKPTSDEFGVVASKVTMLGRALKGARSEISDLKGNFELLLDELEDAVLLFGSDMRLTAAAGTISKFLAHRREELVGLTLAEVFPPGTTLGLMLKKVVQDKQSIHNRHVPIQGTGREAVVMAMLTVEFLESSGGGVLIRLRDPETTHRIGRHLQIADRLAAISRITGGVAHEVKNPLNAILMHVELAKMKLERGDYELQPEMDVISGEILRLDRVVKTFLDFTRPVQIEAVDTSLEDLIREIADLARPEAAGAEIELITESSPHPARVMVDGDLIKQAILNIVVNAIEAMSNSGNQRRAAEGGRRGVLRLRSEVRNECAELRISDTGPGIPRELREKIFNLYFTTKAHGSGIGLAMTFQIIQLHDGTIDFASEPGKGTTFIISLPIAVAAA